MKHHGQLDIIKRNFMLMETQLNKSIKASLSARPLAKKKKKKDVNFKQNSLNMLHRSMVKI